MKKLGVLGLLTMLMLSCVGVENVFAQTVEDSNYKNKKDSQYEYIYMNPPKTSLYAQGRYILTGSGVRYEHSPSKRKRAAHAARINAYNYEAGNY